MIASFCLVAIVRNERDYIIEWLAHYRSIGVRDFLVYDNVSDDGTSEILDRLSNVGVLKHQRWESVEGHSPQLTAYRDAVSRLKHRFDFVAFFDVDEFLLMPSGLTLPLWLAGLAQDVGGVAINQKVFGSSGHLLQQAGLVVQRFQQAAPSQYVENRYVKSIVRPENVAAIWNSHRVELSSGSYILPNGSDAFEPAETTGISAEIDHSALQLNHYILKSEQEFQNKRARGGVIGVTRELRHARYTGAFFSGRDQLLNATIDDQLARRSDIIESEAKVLLSLLS